MNICSNDRLVQRIINCLHGLETWKQERRVENGLTWVRTLKLLNFQFRNWTYDTNVPGYGFSVSAKTFKMISWERLNKQSAGNVNHVMKIHISSCVTVKKKVKYTSQLDVHHMQCDILCTFHVTMILSTALIFFLFFFIVVSQHRGCVEFTWKVTWSFFRKRRLACGYNTSWT